MSRRVPSSTGWRPLRVLELAGYAGVMVVAISRIPLVCSPLWLKACGATQPCRRFLKEGWLGPTFDSADDQWRELRESLPLLFAAIIAHGLLSLLVRKTCPREEVQADNNSNKNIPEKENDTASLNPPPASPPPPPAAPAFLPTGELGRRRALLNAGVSAVFLAVMHGAHGAFPVALVCGAFAVGHAVKGTRLAQPVAWTTAVALIWLKEKWYRALTFEKVLGGGFARLDDFQGLHPWRLSFNLAVLRIVSFNIDLHWAEGAERERQRVKRTAGAAAAAAAPSTADNDDDQQRANRTGGSGGRSKEPGDQDKEIDIYEYSSRVSAHRPMAEYSLWNCLCYSFYAPLYLAGPTLTFNAFVSHMACPQRSYGRPRLLFYLARLVFALLLLEWGVHSLPVFALARSGSLNFKPEILGLFVYTILLIMWLKFLVIWRIFRFWALCDGVEPPENMQRCMTNNYSVVGFWKGWHCSFNRWLVRYIFIPLGGSRPGRRWNVFVVFVFVAFWHDVEPKLFMWGMLNGVFLLLEVSVKELYRRSNVLESCRANPLANRMVQALGATLNVMALLLVNMIGYAVGIQGTGRLAGGMFFDREGLVAVAYGFLFCFSGVQLMFVIEEARHGGNRKQKARIYSYKKVAKA